MFCIFANVNFILGKHDEWIAAYKDLETHVVEHEQDTCLTYYFGIPEIHAQNFSRSPYLFAYEAYGKRDDLYDTHFNSKAMGVFLTKIPQTMVTGLDLVHYEDVCGFLDKANMKECGVIWETRIWTHPGQQQKVLDDLAVLAAWVEKNEPETYTFLVHKGLDFENEIRILERYQTRDALEAHQGRKEVVDFFMSNKEAIRSMVGGGYVPNGLGWLHR